MDKAPALSTRPISQCWPAREPGHQPDSRSAVGGGNGGTLLQSRTTREEGGGGKGGRDGGNHQGFPLWEMRMRRTERFELGRTWYGRLIDRNCPASLGGD